MVDAYRNLAAHMPDNGLQIVMFTHQDAGVWADLALILWAAGLRVTAAWTIGTETESALKEGNYVQGTVLMVLRKQDSDEVAFLDELVPEVEVEVERQLASMLALDDQEDPNFSDADYQLAAYAAALRVLTQYGHIEDIDVAYELSRERTRGEANPIERIIENAVRTASNYLVPKGLVSHLWKRLGPEEKLYLKGLEVEGHGDYRSGVYQEFARGFGVRDYRFMLQTGKANQTRLKTASELKRRELGESHFGRSLVRHSLYAVWRAAETGETHDSLTWLRTELPDYWGNREALVTILRYLSKLEIEHWREDADARPCRRRRGGQRPHLTEPEVGRHPPFLLAAPSTRPQLPVRPPGGREGIRPHRWVLLFVHPGGRWRGPRNHRGTDQGGLQLGARPQGRRDREGGAAWPCDTSGAPPSRRSRRKPAAIAFAGSTSFWPRASSGSECCPTRISASSTARPA